MSINSYWRFSDELTLIQAILLILNVDPENHKLEDFLDINSYASRKGHLIKPDGFDAVYNGLKNSMLNKRLTARIYCNGNNESYYASSMEDESYLNAYSYDWGLSLIDVDVLKAWLSKKGVRTGFFFENENVEKDDFLNPKNQFYAPKLAAALKAWTEVSNNPDLLNGKTPKQALEFWLRNNAVDFGLIKDDGKHNEQGIDDICKVANWEMKGGASPTPTKKTLMTSKSENSVVQKTELKKVKHINEKRDLDDDIPF